MPHSYLDNIINQFAYYRRLGEQTFGQISEEDIHTKLNAAENSIAIIVNHLSGNMLSRWTNFLTEDGEKTWRNRDSEFEEIIRTKAEMLSKWNNGWSCLEKALSMVNEDNIDQIVYIRNKGHTIIEAISRQLAHYSYHVGQIVFIGTAIKGKRWQSLSIPKGDSLIYNQSKFSEPKRREHFTKEFLPKK